jgi:hypothetical protein
VHRRRSGGWMPFASSNENWCIKRLKSQRFCVGQCAVGVVTCMQRIGAGIDHYRIAACIPIYFISQQSGARHALLLTTELQQSPR